MRGEMEYNSDVEKRIIAAATRVFSEKGKDGARMQEIANLAGINKAMLHYYFRSKDKLFILVFQHELKAVLANIFESVYHETDYFTFLRSFVSGYLHNIARRRNLVRFILWEIGRDEPDIFLYFQELFSELGFSENPIVQKTRQAIADQQIQSIDPAHFTVSLLGMCIFPFLTQRFIGKIIPDLNLDEPDFIERRTDEIINLIWNGIRLTN
jgi:TetR/AcrR family transcriptional regulator